MIDRFEPARKELEDAVLAGPGHADAALRRSVADAKDVPPDLRPLIEKIRLHAYKVTEQDIAALKSRYTEDQIFEIVVSAALGAARDRLTAASSAIRNA